MDFAIHNLRGHFRNHSIENIVPIDLLQCYRQRNQAADVHRTCAESAEADAIASFQISAANVRAFTIPGWPVCGSEAGRALSMQDFSFVSTTSGGLNVISFARRSLLCATVLLVVLFHPGDASAQTSMKMVLDWVFQGQHAPYFLANETGIFKDNGLSVQVDRGFGSGDTVAKVAAGAYPVGIADLGSVITFNAKNGGNKIISIFQLLDLAPLSIISLAETKISKPADLVGKKIAAPAGDSSRVMFPVFAKANNLDPNSVSWIDVTPQLRATLLAQKQVDAISAEMHNIINLGEIGVPESDVAVMKYSDFGLKLYGLTFITTPEYAATHKQELTAFLRSIVQAWKATIRDPKTAIAYLKKSQPLIDEKVEMRRFEILLKETIATDTVIKNGISADDPERLKFTAEVITQSIGVPMIDASTLYNGSYLPPRSEMMLPPVK